MSWSNFSISLVIEEGFAPQTVCCGLVLYTVAPRSYKEVKSEIVLRKNEAIVLKLHFLPSPSTVFSNTVQL